MRTILFISFAFLFACSKPAQEQSTAQAEQAVSPQVESATGVYFTNIHDLDTLVSPFAIEMMVDGMLVEPKGEPKEGVGHHHLLINSPFVEEGIIIPADETHIHYGGGQTSDTVALDPGKYLLTLQFANGMHRSYGEKWSKSYTVYVK